MGSAGLQLGSGFLLTSSTAPRSDPRAGNIVFVESIEHNKLLPTISINVMGNPKTEYRPFIDVTTQGITGTWLYDTGASVSCMSVEQFRHIAIPKRPAKHKPLIRLLSAAKTEINVMGLFYLKIKIPGKTFEPRTCMSSNESRGHYWHRHHQVPGVNISAHLQIFQFQRAHSS